MQSVINHATLPLFAIVIIVLALALTTVVRRLHDRVKNRKLTAHYEVLSDAIQFANRDVENAIRVNERILAFYDKSDATAKGRRLYKALTAEWTVKFANLFKTVLDA